MVIIILVENIVLLYGLKLHGPSGDPNYWGPNYLGATVSLILRLSPPGFEAPVTCDEVTLSSWALQMDAGGNSCSTLLVFVEMFA
jgi:hypothetical protein